MRKIIFLLCFALVWSTGNSVWAQTPDGQTPAQETVCDLQSGAAFGLCNAYCEAMDCDSLDPNASPNACERVASNYKKITNSDISCAIACSADDECGNCATPEDTEACCQLHSDPTNPFQVCEPPPPAACTDEDQCGNCATQDETDACCLTHNNDPDNPFPACEGDDGGDD